LRVLSSEDKRILMAIQYNFPISETPFIDIAHDLNLDPRKLISKLREFKERGIIKRIGANLNYKAIGFIKRACLVAFSCRMEDVPRIAKMINESFPEINLKHNYLRDHERYRVWFTLKDASIERIFERVENVAEVCGVNDYLILPSKRVYKMSVKYDLYKGISWSYGFEREPSEVDSDLVDTVVKLQDIPIEEKPLDSDVVSLIREMLKKGVFRDFYGVLSERAIGFNENGMNIVRTENPERVARKLLKFPQITHLVERECFGDWNYSIYFMVHADDRVKIENFRREVEDDLKIEVETLYSLVNLKD